MTMRLSRRLHKIVLSVLWIVLLAGPMLVLNVGVTTSSTADLGIVTGPQKLAADLDPGGNSGSWKSAVVVGISNYQTFMDNNYAKNAAAEWVKFLDDDYYIDWYGGPGDISMGYPDQRATEKNIRDKIKWYAGIMTPGDTFVLVLAGYAGAGMGEGIAFACYEFFGVFNGNYYDSEIASDLARFRDGVNIFVFLDFDQADKVGPNIMGIHNKGYIYCAAARGFYLESSTYQCTLWTYHFLVNNLAKHRTWSMEYTFDIAKQGTFYYYPGSPYEPQEFDGSGLWEFRLYAS